MDYTAFWCITSSFWLVIDSENCVGMLLWKENEYGRSLNNKSIYLSDWKQQLKLRLKPTNLFSNMATQTQNVCPFNKFGYWKHKDMCRKLHIKELCENTKRDAPHEIEMIMFTENHHMLWKVCLMKLERILRNC